MSKQPKEEIVPRDRLAFLHAVLEGVIDQIDDGLPVLLCPELEKLIDECTGRLKHQLDEEFADPPRRPIMIGHPIAPFI